MKAKRVLSVISVVTLLSCGFVPEGFAAEEDYYEWVVPCQYKDISTVTDKYFAAKRDNGETGGCALYKWDGTKVIEDVDHFEGFYENWIVAEKDGKYALYTYDDVKCIVPFERDYECIWLEDENTVIGMQGVEFHPPGYWIGSTEQLDPVTGEVVRKLEDYTSENGTNLPSRFTALEDWSDKMSGFDKVTFANDSKNAQSDPMSVKRIKVYNKDGQLLLDTAENSGKKWSSVTVSAGASILGFYGDDGTSAARNWIYTGRGRLLLKKDGYGIKDGQYIVATTDGSSYDLLTRDGESVLSDYDIIDANYSLRNSDGSGYGTNYLENSDLAIVGRDGQYGVIRLKDYIPKCSEWAVDETSKADAEGLVPDDVKFWWKDSCTRLEFCRMLALTVEKKKGQTLSELAKDYINVSFTDCDNEDVLAAATLGIIKGVGSGKFAPGCFLTREQAATLLSRAATLLEIELEPDALSYSDANEISDWAKDGIADVSSIVSKDGKTVMQGTGNGRFSPKSYYTVEQSVATLYRLLRSA